MLESWSDLSQPHLLVVLMNCKGGEERTAYFLELWIEKSKDLFSFFFKYPLWSFYRILSDKKKVLFVSSCFQFLILFFPFPNSFGKHPPSRHLKAFLASDAVLTAAVGAIYNSVLNVNLIFTSFA